MPTAGKNFLQSSLLAVFGPIAGSVSGISATTFAGSAACVLSSIAAVSSTGARAAMEMDEFSFSTSLSGVSTFSTSGSGSALAIFLVEELDFLLE